MRVVLVDEHYAFRQSLRNLFETKESIQVVGETDNGLDAVALTQEMLPDLVIMDINMTEQAGFEAIKKISEQFPDVIVIALSSHIEKIYTAEAIKHGAALCINRNTVYDEVINAIAQLKKSK